MVRPFASAAAAPLNWLNFQGIVRCKRREQPPAPHRRENYPRIPKPLLDLYIPLEVKRGGVSLPQRTPAQLRQQPQLPPARPPAQALSPFRNQSCPRRVPHSARLALHPAEVHTQVLWAHLCRHRFTEDASGRCSLTRRRCHGAASTTVAWWVRGEEQRAFEEHRAP